MHDELRLIGCVQPVPISINNKETNMSRETAFNLEQFTPGAIAAMKANPAAMKAIHAATHGGKLFPSRPGSESVTVMTIATPANTATWVWPRI